MLLTRQNLKELNCDLFASYISSNLKNKIFLYGFDGLIYRFIASEKLCRKLISHGSFVLVRLFYVNNIYELVYLEEVTDIEGVNLLIKEGE